MRKFWVIWTYIGNYSDCMEVQGNSAEEVAKSLMDFYSADFRKRGNIYVFDKEPAFKKIAVYGD